MESLIQTYLPNVYKMGWAGQAGWGTAIYLTLYMTVLSFIIGGFLGLVAGLFLVLTAPGGVLENKVVLYFPCGSLYHPLGNLVSPLSLDCEDKYWAKCSPCSTFFCSLCLLCPSSAGCLG